MKEVAVRSDHTRDSIKVGISSCLLGQRVRFDGGHKRDSYIMSVLAPFFTFVPICPELEVGMGVPRETVRLVGSAETPSMIGVKSGEDWTDRMNRNSKKRVVQSDLREICGYILKKDSPSCGMERVKLYGSSPTPKRIGRGLFVTVLIDQFPLLPIEEEGRLNDAAIRENFIERVFAYHRFQVLFRKRWSRGEVVEFHARHKYLLLAHSPKHYQELGRLVAQIKSLPAAEFRDRYSTVFMEGMAVKATRKKQTNVLMHILGFLRNHLDESDRRSIRDVIDDYHRGLTPLVVPITLLGHYARKHNVSYIVDQVYLAPHPKELMLRNSV